MIISAAFSNYSGAKQLIVVANSKVQSELRVTYCGIGASNPNLVDTNIPALIFGVLERVGSNMITHSYSTTLPLFVLNFAGALGDTDTATNKHTAMDLVISDNGFVGGISKSDLDNNTLVYKTFNVKLFSEDLVSGIAQGVTQILTFDSTTDVTGTLVKGAVRSNATGISLVYDYGLSLPQLDIANPDTMSLIADTDYDDVEITESLWLSCADWATADGYIVDYSGGGADGYYAKMNAGFLEFHVWDGAVFQIASYDAGLLTSGYHAIQFQIGVDEFGDSVANIYVDGVAVANVVVGTYSVTIGYVKYYGSNQGASDGLVCDMDEVTLWRGATYSGNIGDTQFTQLYNQGIGTDNQGLTYLTDGGYNLPILPRYEFQFEDNQYDSINTHSRNKLQGTDKIHLVFQAL